jgi:hypothetical protein
MPEIIIFVGIVSAVLWLIIGWRAMLAHERIAESIALHLMSISKQEDELTKLRRENALQHRHYKEFRLQHPEVDSLPAKERHEVYRRWLDAQGYSDSPS